MNEYDFLYKILLIGDSGVGKSSLMMRFTDSDFLEAYISTIGVDFRIKTVEVNGKIAKLQIWDTAGQERFRTITNSYYRGAHGILLVYDVTNQKSFDHLMSWLQEITHHTSETTRIVLVGNKADLERDRQVTFENGQKLADSLGFTFIESSAKDNWNVEKSFHVLTREIGEKPTNRKIRLIPKSEKINDSCLC